MKLLKAKKRIRTQKVIGLMIMIAAFLFMFCCGMKSLYFNTPSHAGLLGSLVDSFHSLIKIVYRNTQFMSWVWYYAPIIRPFNLNTSGNYGFLFIVLFGAAGRLILDSANHLASRVKCAENKAEETQWKNEALGKNNSQKHDAPNAAEIHVDIKKEDEWYKRPIGVILLGLIVVVIGQWLNLSFGLAG